MQNEKLQEIVRTTKEKSLEIGVIGLRFDFPQVLKHIQIQPTNYLGIVLDKLLDNFQNSTDSVVIDAVKEVRKYEQLVVLSGEKKYSFTYKHPKERRSKKPIKILVEATTLGEKGELGELIGYLESIGYQEEMEEFKLKWLFDKDSESLKWDLFDYVESVRKGMKPSLDLLVERAIVQIDKLVLEVEKEIEELK